MTDDERAIRDLVATWMTASKAGDTATVLGLMTDDVLFTVAGREPFGKAAFAAASQGAPPGVTIDGTSDIQEIKVLGDWAYMRNKLSVTVTPPNGKTMRRAGYTLSILRKEGGTWRLARDANLMTEVV
jgi:uncharacterized protein (TIGR02246 family)